MEPFNSPNCQRCAEYEDNKEPTKLCNDCKCFKCNEIIHNCYSKKFCKKENSPIEF